MTKWRRKEVYEVSNSFFVIHCCSLVCMCLHMCLPLCWQITCLLRVTYCRWFDDVKRLSVIHPCFCLSKFRFCKKEDKAIFIYSWNLLKILFGNNWIPLILMVPRSQHWWPSTNWRWVTTPTKHAKVQKQCWLLKGRSHWYPPWRELKEKKNFMIAEAKISEKILIWGKWCFDTI